MRRRKVLLYRLHHFYLCFKTNCNWKVSSINNCAGRPEAICGWSGPAVGGEVVDIKLAREARGKILDLAIFSSQEALSLHFCFKLGALII